MPMRRLPLSCGPQRAGFVERLYFQALDNDLKAGRIRTACHGKIVSKAEAERVVAYARSHGWLPPCVSIYRNN